MGDKEQKKSRQQEIREKIKALKTNGLLPLGYAKKIKEKYPHLNENTIYGAASGRAGGTEVQMAIIELAEEFKEEKRLERLNALLDIDEEEK